MKRGPEFGQALGGIGLLLLYVATAFMSRRLAPGAWLWIIGWLFFGCGRAGRPWWRLTPVAWVFVVFGLLLMALAAVWVFIYDSPWLGPLAAGTFLVSLTFMAVGL